MTGRKQLSVMSERIIFNPIQFEVVTQAISPSSYFYMRVAPPVLGRVTHSLTKISAFSLAFTIMFQNYV